MSRKERVTWAGTKAGLAMRIGVLGLVATLAGSVIPPASARSATPAGIAPVAGIANLNSNMCLVARGFDDGAPVVQTQCDQRYRDQVWYFVEMSPAWYLLQNTNSGLCMVVRGTDDGARLVQTRCDGRYGDQWWNVMPPAGAIFQLYNYNSRMCMVVRGDADGAPAVQTTCDSAYWDQWWFQQTLD